MTGPDRIPIYVCVNPECRQWTAYRRTRCAWCDDWRPLVVVSYVNEGVKD